jgi:CBS domain-containing membrane protein
MNHLWGDITEDENIVTAVFGVSALCIFLFPNNKFFAPLVLIEANLLASCVAFICIYIFPWVSLGVLFAVIGTMIGMYLLQCINPPAIFLSIFLVMAETTSYDFALHPVLADSILVALASYLNKIIIERFVCK